MHLKGINCSKVAFSIAPPLGPPVLISIWNPPFLQCNFNGRLNSNGLEKSATI